MQSPWQQSLGVVVVLGVQVSPVFLQGVAHALASAQIVVPVSYRSVQHPLEQSAFEVQVCSQTLVVPMPLTQDSPEQQLEDAQLLPCPTHRPASWLGLAQALVLVAAAPVQKHEASSKVMQVYAAQ